MEHNNKSIPGAPMVEVARCPQCNALCMNGNDDDNQIFCAKCGKSFNPQVFTLTKEEFEEMKGKATATHEKSAWVAYTVDDVG